MDQLASACKVPKTSAVTGDFRLRLEGSSVTDGSKWQEEAGRLEPTALASAGAAPKPFPG